MKRFTIILLSACAFSTAFLMAQTRQAAPPAKPLDIYVIDVEGGGATLFVTPTGQSLLIDTGFGGTRDTDRIMAAINDAGLKQLDYMLLTHYHTDHVGNAIELSKRIPVGKFVDHGPTVEGPVNPALREQVPGFQQAYAELNAGKHLVVKPGDTLPITGVDWRIVTSAGNALKTPLVGAGRPNPLCADFKPKEITTDPENGQSVGSVVALGQFRTIQLGDLLWNKEFDLMCPTNKVGTVDLYLVSHHGSNPSGSEVLVHALRPRVSVMQNGTRKGGAPDTMQTIHSAPGMEDLWQTHWSYPAGLEMNSPALLIANIEDNATIAGVLTAPPRGAGGGGGGNRGGAPGAGQPAAGAPTATGAPATPPVAAPPPATPPTAPPTGAGTAAPATTAAPAPGAAAAGAPAQAGGRGAGGGGGRGGQNTGHEPAYWIKISARADGSFTVTNPRNNFSKTYAKR